MAGNGVDEVLKGLDGVGRDAAEVGALWIPAADMAVGVFDGALFPSGIGMGVIDLQEGIDLGKEGLDPAGVEELAAVVGGDGKDLLHLPAADQAAQGSQDFDLIDSAYFGDEIEAGLAFDQDKQSAFAMDAGDDGVHLPMAELGAGGKVGPVFDGQVVRFGEGSPDGPAPFGPPLGMVGCFAVKDPDVTVVDMGIDGADGGNEGQSFGEQFLACMGRGFAFVFDFGGQETGQDVGELHAPALILGSGVDVVLGDMLRVLPVFLAFVKHRLVDTAAMYFPMQGGVRQADLVGQFPHG